MVLQIRFIGSNHITSHELLAFNGVWAGLQLWEVLLWVQRRLTAKQFGQFVTLAVLSVVGMAVSAVILLTVTGRVKGVLTMPEAHEGVLKQCKSGWSVTQHGCYP